MENEIISYIEMCQREGTSLQKGMNFGLRQNHSVVLMSLRENAPYRDRLEEDGTTLIYEGHDAARNKSAPEPKRINQPELTPTGTLTENGKFHKAAQDYKNGLRLPERVQVYEKLHRGIWSYNGVFHLANSWIENDGIRNVFKFKLVAVKSDDDFSKPANNESERRRIIPTSVKLEVWKRDSGKCVICGASDELHFDHIVPFSKGGTSVSSSNVQLLCARHNLEKRDKIE